MSKITVSVPDPKGSGYVEADTLTSEELSSRILLDAVSIETLNILTDKIITRSSEFPTSSLNDLTKMSKEEKVLLIAEQTAAISKLKASILDALRYIRKWESGNEK